MKEIIFKINEVKGVKCTVELNNGYTYDYTNGGYEIITNKEKIELLISDEQNCCENFGYFWTNDDDIKNFLGAELYDIKIVDTSLNVKKFNKEVGNLDEGNVMFVNLETDKGTLQFTAYNSHNGYYGHTAVVRSNRLNYEIGL